MDELVWTFLLSMTPLGEMRISIPYAIASGVDPLIASTISVAGAMIPAAVIAGYWHQALKFMERILPRLGRAAEWVLTHTRKRGGKIFEIGKDLVVFVFAASPVPIIGGSYTAAVAAVAFDVSYGRAMWLILLGLIVQAFIIVLAAGSLIK